MSTDEMGNLSWSKKKSGTGKSESPSRGLSLQFDLLHMVTQKNPGFLESAAAGGGRETVAGDALRRFSTSSHQIGHNSL